jgi:hypothetical protein
MMYPVLLFNFAVYPLKAALQIFNILIECY